MDGDRASSHPASGPLSGDGAAADGARFQAEAFRMAGWTVVPQAHELVRPGETVRIEPRPMEVLVYLAERAGEAVSREDLMEAVWPGVFVTEHALNRCVSQLRKLFDDDPRDPRVIETIPKAGYRLIAPVERVGDGLAAPVEALDVRVLPSPRAAAAPRRAGTGRRLMRGSLVVLPLAVLAAVVWWPRPAAPTTRPLTLEPGLEIQAAWSPDGTRLAYTHADPDGRHAIYVRTLGSDTPVRLTDGPRDADAAWSPDGAQLAFVRCADAGCAVYAMDALGGEARRLLDEPRRIQGIDWSPDGRAMALTMPDSAGGPPRLWRVDLRTGTRRRLTDPGAAAEADPVFSPDGRWILVERRTLAGADLYRVPAAGGDAQPLTDERQPLAGHTWAADGRSVLFSSARSGVYALWRVPAGGGAIEPVVGPAVRDPGGPVLARTGGRLAVADWQFEINLWRSVDGGPPERLVASSLWDKQPALSPDGARLAFISNRTGPPELWTGRTTATDPGLVRLTDFGGPAVEHPRFSPDGAQIVFQARSEGHSDLWIVEAAGGTPRRLTDHPAEDVGPRFSRDGRAVYFGSDRAGRWQVWRVPVDGGPPEAVAEGITAEETADGALLVTRRDEPGLWRVEAGEARRIAPGPFLGDWASWVLTGRGVLGLNRPAGRLALLDARTGLDGPLDVDLGPLMQHEGTFAASADGRVVVWARIDRVEADLLLVEPVD